MRTQRFSALDLNLLRVFDEVMASKNITRAAEQLNMTQPAVSNALRRLREALGDDLVQRAGYGIEPTPRGAALWPAIREALAMLENELAPDRFDPKGSQQNFVLAMADATAAMLMPPLIETLERDAPNVNLRIVPLTTRDPRGLLEAGDIDVAIGYFPAAVASIGLAAMQTGTADAFSHAQLYSGEYVCVMRRGHPLAKRRKNPTLTIEEYCAAKHLLVSFSGRPYGFIDEALAPLGRTRRIVLTVNQFFTAGQVVAGSDLLTVLPRHFLSATGIRDAFAVAELPFDVPQVHVDMIWHRRSQANTAQQWLRGAIQAAAKLQLKHWIA